MDETAVFSDLLDVVHVMVDAQNCALYFGISITTKTKHFLFFIFELASIRD